MPTPIHDDADSGDISSDMEQPTAAPQQQRSVLFRHRKAVVAVSVAMLVAVVVGVSVSTKPKSNNSSNLLEPVDSAASSASPQDSSTSESSSSSTNTIISQAPIVLTTEEKVASESKVSSYTEDPSAQVSTYDGPTTDFLAAARIITQANTNLCADNEVETTIELTTDDYPWETSWSISGPDGSLLAFGPPSGSNYNRRTQYLGKLCLPEGDNVLTVNDAMGDGPCCTYGPGEFKVTAEGEVLVQSDDANFKTKDFPFTLGGKIITDSVSTTATDPPTTVSAPVTGNCVDVDLTLVTDKYGKLDTSYSFVSKPSDGSDPIIYINKQIGELDNEQTYADTFCLPPGTYTLTVEDKFRGLCCAFGQGYYSVNIDGEEVLYGGNAVNFQNPMVHDILVGYDANISERDNEWLLAHNSRRQQFHEDEKTDYRPLVWSTELAKDAADWVDVILPECKLKRENNLLEGENMSFRTVGNQRTTEGPEDILTRWVDNKVGKTYPTNQSLTQAMWRATRYVGCSDKFLEREDGTICYASICRYARAGNCAMGQYDDWKVPTLMDRTQCGPLCPPEGCH